MNHEMEHSAQVARGVRGERLAIALGAALFGFFILYGVGFAQSDTLHNAAHDTRHAFAFPCH